MVQTTSHWVHNIDPVIFQLTDALAVRWYGLAYVASFAISFWLVAFYWKKGKSPISPPMQEQYFLYGILGVILGGRLGYMFLYDFGEFIANPLIFFRVWEGGMASHGGFLGVALGTYILSRKWKIAMLKIWDINSTITPVGLLLGRLANFINGELWGKPTEVAWGVIFPNSAAPGTPIEFIPARHPSQLYQAGLEGLLLLLFVQWRFWRTDVLKTPGRLCGEFLVAYSVLRILGEIFREPDATLIFGISRGSFYSFFFAGVGVLLVIYTKAKNSNRAV